MAEDKQLSGLVIEDMDVFRRVSGEGPLYMVSLCPPAPAGIIVLGTRVDPRRVSSVRRLMTGIPVPDGEIERRIAVTAVKMMLRDRGFSFEFILSCEFTARPTSFEELAAVQRELEGEPVTEIVSIIRGGQ